MRALAATILQPLRSVPPVLLDGAVGLSLACGGWVWTVLEPERGVRPADGLALALSVAVNLPLAVRRRAPVAVLLVSASMAAVYHALGYHYGQNTMASLLALYSVAVHRSTGVALAGVVPVVAEWTYATAHFVAWWSAMVQALVVSGVALGIGTSSRMLARRNGQLAELAERLRREQEAAARRAVTHERVKIARELHDVVAHHMSVVSVQAGLGRYVVFSDPGTAYRALETIADTSREALSEMRRLLSILRVEVDETAEERYSTAPGLQRLEALVDRMRLAEMPVELTVEGRPAPLTPGLDLCAYRIAQEALTNVLKHAPGARTRVVVTYGATTLTLRISNDAAADVPRRPGAAFGHGLIGMRERVSLYQGTISAKPRPEGGFEVIATFPVDPVGSARPEAEGVPSADPDR